MVRANDALSGLLAQQHARQVERAPWPDFSAFDASRYDVALRERAGRQWLLRAREEYGSCHEFSALLAALTRIGAPLPFTGTLARLLTDEARHAELCFSMAAAILGEEKARAWQWEAPTPPFAQPPLDDLAAIPFWAADVVLTSCCLGETLSVPLYEALATVTTDPVAKAVVHQIRKDEKLHSTFGFETLAWLLELLDEGERARLQKQLSRHLGGFEASCSAGQRLEDLVGQELVIEEPAEDAPPNLGLQDPRNYAIVFYATIENEVFPRLNALGFDALDAWARRRSA